jgi:hypothetical protein
VFCSSVIQAQENKTVNNFSVNENGRIIWQKVFEDTTIKFDDIINSIKSNDVFKNVEFNDNRITFWVKSFETDPKAVGFSRMTTQFYVLSNQKAFFTIDYKLGKYRITAVNFSNFPPTIDLSIKVEYEEEPLETMALSEGSFNSYFSKKGSLIIDNAIQKLFKINKSIDKNW